jgi:3-oxoacyl-[acyl-carrier protein] reductase
VTQIQPAHEDGRPANARTVLITGGSRGIGAAIARRFSAEGYQVALNYCRSAAYAENLAAELNARQGRAAAFQADVSRKDQVQAMVEAVLQTFGSIDVLVNNAGIAQQKMFQDITEAEWQRMFDVNVKGMYHCCQAVLPGMLQRKAGKIINISSMWGMVGASCEVHYSAAKAAVLGMTKALAKELGPSRIQVNCVAPGVISTDMNKALDEEAMAAILDETPLGCVGAPSDIASAVWYLASDQAGFITGQVLSPNGGLVI